MTTKSLLKYRNIWMGIAMLWVVWYHTNLKVPFVPLEHLRIIGYGGVDICLFASGAGCYLSLCRDSDPFRFMKRRFSRLLPTYLLFMSIWLFFRFLTNPMPLSAALGNLLGVQCFTGLGNYFNWYISAIFLFYLIAPVFKGMAEQVQGTLRHTAIILLLIAFSLPFWYTGDLLNVMTRLPVFYLGMLLGKQCQHDASMSKTTIGVSLAGSCVGMAFMLFCYRYLGNYLWDWGLLWYPFVLITPGLCIAVSLIAEKATRYAPAKPLLKALDIIGQYSFEVYLVHILVFDIHGYLNACSMIPKDAPYVWPVNFACIIAGTAALRFGTNAVKKAVNSITQKNKQSV